VWWGHVGTLKRYAITGVLPGAPPGGIGTGRKTAVEDVVGTQRRRPGGATARGVNAPTAPPPVGDPALLQPLPGLPCHRPVAAGPSGWMPLPTPPGMSLLPAHPGEKRGWGPGCSKTSSGAGAGTGSGASVGWDRAPFHPAPVEGPLASTGWARYRSPRSAGAAVQGAEPPPRMGSWPLLPSCTPAPRNNTVSGSGRLAAASVPTGPVALGIWERRGA